MSAASSAAQHERVPRVPIIGPRTYRALRSGAPPARLGRIDQRHAADRDEQAHRQRHLHGHARRGIVRERLGEYLVDLPERADVGHQHRDVHDEFRTASAGPQDGSDVAHRLARLLADGLPHRLARRRIGSRLTGHIQEAAGANAGRVRADRGRYVGSCDHLSLRAHRRLSFDLAGTFPRGGTVEWVRIATWNVNSVKQRLPRLLPWLDERQPDVVCLQETKLADDAFADLLHDELAARTYEVAAHGEPAWNGVAILSRAGLEDVVTGIAGGPGFPHQEARAVSATCDGIRVVSVYVPNGRVPDSEHYRYKLEWLTALKEMVAGGPEATIVCGDMNIAPADQDVFDPDAYIGQTHVTEPERAALAELQAAFGLHDVV